jgi:hypothetical protein
MAILGLDVHDDLGAVLFQCDLEDASACERNAQGRQHDEFGTPSVPTLIPSAAASRRIKAAICLRVETSASGGWPTWPVP